LHRRSPSFEECTQNSTYLLDVWVAPRLVRYDADVATLGNLDVARVDQAQVSAGSWIPCKGLANPLGDRDRFVPIQRDTVLE
jgi:hypothetical protein